MCRDLNPPPDPTPLDSVVAAVLFGAVAVPALGLALALAVAVAPALLVDWMSGGGECER